MTSEWAAGDGTITDPDHIERDGFARGHHHLYPLPDGDVSAAQLTAQLVALQGRVASMPEIEQAKGVLMLTHGLTADAAFAMLCTYSQEHNVKIRDIASRLVNNLATVVPCAAVARDMDRLLEDVTTGPGARPATGGSGRNRRVGPKSAGRAEIGDRQMGEVKASIDERPMCSPC